MIRVIQRSALIQYVEYILYFNEDHTAGWLPVFTFLTSQGFTYGLNIFHNDFLGHDEELSFSARYGGRFAQGYLLTL